MGFFRRRYKEIIEAEKNRKENEDGWDWVQKNQWPTVPVMWCPHAPIASLWSLIFVSSIFGRKKSSPDFSEAPLMLFSSSSCQARCRPEMATSSQVTWLGPPRPPFTNKLRAWERRATEQSNIYGCNIAWSALRGNCYLKVFFINVSLLYWSCLYICIDVL